MLDYIYGVLHSPSYRRQYIEFLKIDFPRVPVPVSDDEFSRFVQFGSRLRRLHLFSDTAVHEPITTYPIAGSNVVEQFDYVDGNVNINSTQYFGNVPEEVWEFFISGYQPAQKWLKDRKGSTLSDEDIDHYQRIVRVLSETGSVMAEIDDMRVSWRT